MKKSKLMQKLKLKVNNRMKIKRNKKIIKIVKHKLNSNRKKMSN